MPKASISALDDGDGFHEVHIEYEGRILVFAALVAMIADTWRFQDLLPVGTACQERSFMLSVLPTVSVNFIVGDTKMRLKDLSETFRNEHKYPELAAGYLQAALEENDLGTFLVALRDVVQANGGMAKTAQETELGRESLYKILSENGSPQFLTVQAVLKSLGLQFSIIANPGG